VYEIDLSTQKQTLLKQQEVPGGFDSANYVSERHWATATDGTKVPISLVYHKNFTISPNSPLLLYSYGSYGISTDPYFSTSILPLLDRGVIYAIAHIRGGQELGRHWYDNGKLLQKNNTFTDFIACADYLVEQGYTSHNRLVIRGGSAGGLLLGAVLNLRPDICKAACLLVPFVDALNTMLDDTLPLTVGEYEEWGNPNEKQYYDYILSYSPYDNIQAKDYPNVLVLTGFHDTNVSYWEPAKWVAKLREHKTDNNLLLLKTNMVAGHSGASGRYDAIREIAYEYAFVLAILGLNN
jgi:oligopeptidase B